jgi:tetratricopeptide (TPR) repeat protein
LEQWKQAADDAKECIRLDPNFVKGYYRSAVAQIALGEHDSAIATIRQGLVVDNNNLPLTKLLRKAQQQKKVSMARQQSNLVHNDNAAHGEVTSHSECRWDDIGSYRHGTNECHRDPDVCLTTKKGRSG